MGGCIRSDITFKWAHRLPNHISKTVPPTIHLGPPPCTVDSTIFEMWLGSLSTHRGLAIPVV